MGGLGSRNPAWEDLRRAAASRGPVRGMLIALALIAYHQVQRTLDYSWLQAVAALVPLFAWLSLLFVVRAPLGQRFVTPIVGR